MKEVKEFRKMLDDLVIELEKSSLVMNFKSFLMEEAKPRGFQSLMNSLHDFDHGFKHAYMQPSSTFRLTKRFNDRKMLNLQYILMRYY